MNWIKIRKELEEGELYLCFPEDDRPYVLRYSNGYFYSDDMIFRYRFCDFIKCIKVSSVFDHINTEMVNLHRTNMELERRTRQENDIIRA